MLELGTAAPAFALPDAISGTVLDYPQCAGDKGLLIAFICNHCPYVQHLLAGFIQFARDYQPRGIGVVAISSNDIEAYPQDAPGPMKVLAGSVGFTFPYLFDESQQVALAYQAVCTPDFFLFDAGARLTYRGQFDSSRPKSSMPVTGRELRTAADAMLRGEAVASQVPSMGCSIKWKAANAPQWA